MSIPLTGTGGLFTRIGAIGGTIDALNAARGTTVPAHVGSVQSQYTTADQDVISSLYSFLSGYQVGGSSLASGMRSIAQSTAIRMADDSASLPANSVANALNALVSQMRGTGQSVQSCAVSSSTSYLPGNSGNPVVVVSMADANGRATELAFAESITGTATNDYQSSSSLAGVEPISIIGQQAVPDIFSWLYPGGSGTANSVSAVSGMSGPAGGTSNWLKNGSMETFTVANVPDGWHVTVGTPGITVAQATGTVYDGASSLEYIGDGSTGIAARQQFSVSGSTYDTPITIYPNTQFAVNLFLYLSSVPAAGTLRVALSDGTNPIADNSGNANAFSVSLPGLAASAWTPVSGTFRTPNKLPTTGVFLEIKLTTPLSVGSNLYIDRVAFSQMTRLYAGGPSVSVFSGNRNMVRGDAFIINVSNDYNGKFQILFDRLFSMKSLGLILPSSGSPTIPDSLIA